MTGILTVDLTSRKLSHVGTSKENLEAIKEALKAGGNKHYIIEELPNLNHLFQTVEAGALTEYAKIEETISPTALKLIADWIKKSLINRKHNL